MTPLKIGNAPLGKLRLWSLMAGATWIVVAIFCWIFAPHQFYRSYLFAWLFWLGASLGAMGIVMMHHLIGGEWGIVSRRLGEHAAMCVGLLVVLFVPIAFGAPVLYEWADRARVHADALLRHKQPYLNYGFFILRAIVYGAAWLSLAWFLRRGSLRQGRTADAGVQRGLYDASALGEVILFLTMSFAAVDWIMSRDARWTSTVFGLIVVCGQGITGLCVMILLLGLLRNQEPFRQMVRRDHFNDLGNVLLTLVILWTYMAFAQLLVIWMGNRQQENSWYVSRLSNGWWWIGLGILVLHFFVPFVILLMRDAKRSPVLMMALCGGLLVMRALDVFWMVAPNPDTAKPLLREALSWMDFVFPIGMGGLWFAMFLRLMEPHPPMVEGIVAVNAELRDAEP